MGAERRSQKNVGILIFEGVEVLDFSGPFEVFSVAGRLSGQEHSNVFTIGDTLDPISTRGGLSVNPTYDLSKSPPIDILIVPGGTGTRREIHNQKLLEWIIKRAAEAELTLSVCTGALLLAKAGLLGGLEVTTHHDALDLLKELEPRGLIRSDRRFVDNGRIILSAGISAGIDMSLYVIAKLHGKELALRTARQMEYAWNSNVIS